MSLTRDYWSLTPCAEVPRRPAAHGGVKKCSWVDILIVLVFMKIPFETGKRVPGWLIFMQIRLRGVRQLRLGAFIGFACRRAASMDSDGRCGLLGLCGLPGRAPPRVNR
jgi:hypothetical protein